MTKTDMFPLNQAATLITASCFPFRIINKGFIEIRPAFSSLFTENFGISFVKYKIDMVRWMNPPLLAV